MSAPTAEDQAAQALAATPTPQLLRAAYALTHRMDACRAKMADTPAMRRKGPARDAAVREQADLRQQRDLIDAEVLRRTGDR